MVDFESYSRDAVHFFSLNVPPLLASAVEAQPAGFTILDLGCGDGNIIHALQHGGFLNRAGQVIGVDLSPQRIAGCLADMHFAPTERARLNLIREAVPREHIFVTGNTIVDALKSISLADGFDDDLVGRMNLSGCRLLLVTAHRRETHGQPLRSICRALRTLADTFEDVGIV